MGKKSELGDSLAFKPVLYPKWLQGKFGVIFHAFGQCFGIVITRIDAPYHVVHAFNSQTPCVFNFAEVFLSLAIVGVLKKIGLKRKT
ncbi:hypothetical protein D3C87_1960980 [compost metagenome]